jgi:hypothetical protein
MHSSTILRCTVSQSIPQTLSFNSPTYSAYLQPLPAAHNARLDQRRVSPRIPILRGCFSQLVGFVESAGRPRRPAQVDV